MLGLCRTLIVKLMDLKCVRVCTCARGARGKDVLFLMVIRRVLLHPCATAAGAVFESAAQADPSPKDALPGRSCIHTPKPMHTSQCANMRMHVCARTRPQMHTHTYFLQVLDTPWEGPSAAAQAVWEGLPAPAPPLLAALPPPREAASLGPAPSATEGAAPAAPQEAPQPLQEQQQQQQQQESVQGNGGAGAGPAGEKPRSLRGPQIQLHLPSLVLDVSATYEERAEACKDMLREFMFAIPKVSTHVWALLVCLRMCVCMYVCSEACARR